MGSQLPAGRNLNFAMNDAGGKSGVKDKVKYEGGGVSNTLLDPSSIRSIRKSTTSRSIN